MAQCWTVWRLLPESCPWAENISDVLLEAMVVASRSMAQALRAALTTSSVATGFGRHGMPPPVCDHDLWLFDAETGVRVASKVGNLHPKFGMLSLWVLELFAMYVTYGQTDGWTKAMLIAPLPTVGVIINEYLSKRQSKVSSLLILSGCQVYYTS